MAGRKGSINKKLLSTSQQVVNYSKEYFGTRHCVSAPDHLPSHKCTPLSPSTCVLGPSTPSRTAFLPPLSLALGKHVTVSAISSSDSSFSSAHEDF